ncbi:MAG: lipocalin-like domain-containing protein [Burkholderiales bacterium]
MRRREFLIGAGSAVLMPRAWAGVRYPAVVPGRALNFPRDHGAHPEYRTEWWYVTGWLAGAGGEPLGFQVTFFRARPDIETQNPSAFTPRQVMLAHAALSDPRHGRLRHDERAARAALGLAGADEERTRAWVDDWRLELDGERYRTRIVARGFALELEFTASGAPLAQGEGGLSRKGQRSEEASYYYSRPHLKVRGAIERGGATEAVTGSAWLDHEWSSQYMAPEAAGWDWVGINLADGGALMLFRMRARQGGTYYAGGTLVRADGARRVFTSAEASFQALRIWRSPRTGVEYPVAMRVAAGSDSWTLEPLMNDQELDARASTGTIYWEGAVRALRDGREAGRGYLELTGYWRPMKL